jgi:hypothetical protein
LSINESDAYQMTTELGCLKVAAKAQFSCPQFGPHALRPISYLGTLLAFEVHVTPDSSILAIMI